MGLALRPQPNYAVSARVRFGSAAEWRCAMLQTEYSAADVPRRLLWGNAEDVGPRRQR